MKFIHFWFCNPYWSLQLLNSSATVQIHYYELTFVHHVFIRHLASPIEFQNENYEIVRGYLNLGGCANM